MAASAVVMAQQPSFERLPAAVIDVVPPSNRVAGAPGTMRIEQTSCRSLPLAAVRRRIVDVAVQEWGFFGFGVIDQTAIEPPEERPGREAPPTRRRWARLNPAQSARVADSIAGYWTVTPQAGWILDAQNDAWTGPDGIASRWRYPWSAAFISWVMCEGGLDDEQFQRAVAHHVYIDQAIRATATRGAASAFTAHDIGEAPVVPGDLLCSARRPAYGSIAERRRQIGAGARTHCDIVVKVDEARERILAIGGNVRASVSLKLLPGERHPDGDVRPVPGARRMFAHLKLRADTIEADALDRSPTMQALVCGEGRLMPTWRAAADLMAETPPSC